VVLGRLDPADRPAHGTHATTAAVVFGSTAALTVASPVEAIEQIAAAPKTPDPPARLPGCRAGRTPERA
jgi:hypothetical protein